MGWVKMKLGDVIKNREGRYKPNDPTIAGLKRIDKINFSGQIFLSDKGSNTDMILIKKGDLVISGINVEKGALAVYEGEDDILATIHYSSYIFDTAKIDIDFLKVFLRSPDFIQLLKEQVPGGIKTEIKPKHILPLEVYFPETTTEQKVIAEHFFEKEAKFNQLDMHISYQLTQLENLNQAILQEAVQGKLVKQSRLLSGPKDEPASELLKLIKAEKAKSGKKEKSLPPIKPEEIPFEIPKNWVWCRLGEICDVLGGFAFDSTRYSKVETQNQVIRLGNVKPNQLVLETSPVFIDDEYALEVEKYILKENDILITMTGTKAKRDYLFSLCLNSDDLKTKNIFLNQRVGCFRFAEFIYPDFINSALKDLSILSPVFDSSTGAANQANIGMAALKDILIPLPPLPEQKRIVAEIEKQFAKTKQLKEHIIANQQATEQLLKALLHQAFEVEEMEEV